MNEKTSKILILVEGAKTDLLLIFDLDPQDPQFSSDKILEMMNFFVESSDMGKLYLNYPMVESFYHMKDIPDREYATYIATIDELIAKTYKQQVNQENRNHDYSKFAINRVECTTIIQQNIEKAWYISKMQHIVEDMDNLLPNSVEVLIQQLKKMQTEKVVSVLCTCTFYIAEYNPKFILV